MGALLNYLKKAVQKQTEKLQEQAAEQAELDAQKSSSQKSAVEAAKKAITSSTERQLEQAKAEVEAQQQSASSLSNYLKKAAQNQATQATQQAAEQAELDAQKSSNQKSAVEAVKTALVSNTQRQLDQTKAQIEAQQATQEKIKEKAKELTAKPMDDLSVAAREERKAKHTMDAYTQLMLEQDALGFAAPTEEEAEAHEGLLTNYQEKGKKVTEEGGVANASGTLGNLAQYGSTLANYIIAGLREQATNVQQQEAREAETQLIQAGDYETAERKEQEVRDMEENLQTRSKVQEYLDEATQWGQTQMEANKVGRSEAGKFLVDLVMQGEQMAADAALGALTGTNLLPMYMRSAGGAEQTATADGADARSALMYGRAVGGVEAFTEKMYDGLSGIFGKGMADDVVEAFVNRVAEDQLGRAALQSFFNFAGEFGEELASGIVDPALQSIYNGKSIGENWSELEVSELMYDAFVGGVMGLLGGSAEVMMNYSDPMASDVQTDTRKTNEKVRDTLNDSQQQMEIMAKYGLTSLGEDRTEAGRTLSEIFKAEDAQAKAAEAWETEKKEAREIFKTKNNGKVVDETDSGIKTRTLNAQQKVGMQVARTLADMGHNIHVFQSETVDGQQMLPEKLRAQMGRETAPNGWYDTENGDIWVDLNAGKDEKGTMAYTLAHELTHKIKAQDSTSFNHLASFLYRNYGRMGISMELLAVQKAKDAAAMGRTITQEVAMEEVVADSMEAMLTDTDVLDKLDALKAENQPVWKTIRDNFRRFARQFDIAYEGINPDSLEGQMLQEMKGALDELAEYFAVGAAKASAKKDIELPTGKAQENTAKERTPGLEKGTEAREAKAKVAPEVMEEAGKGAKVIPTKDGNPAAVVTKEGGILLSERTWNEGGKDKFDEAMEENGYSEEERKNAIAYIDSAVAMLQQVAEEFNNETLKTSLDATVVLNASGKAVLHTLTTNGDYPVNFDLSTICKKRKAYQRFLDRIVKNGIINNIKYDAEAIAQVRQKMQDAGYEVACAPCFVEARRVQIQAWAEIFVEEWNAEVLKVNPNADYFGFTNGEVKWTDETLAKLESELGGAKRNAKGNLNLGKGSVQTKMQRLLQKAPQLARLMTNADLMTPSALVEMRKMVGGTNLYSLIQQRYGTATPKITQEFSPYNSDAALMTFSYIKDINGEAVGGTSRFINDAIKQIEQETGEKLNKNDKRVQDLALRNYLYALGGARSQSFSDAVIENVLDKMQLYADLAARKLPLQEYTKEISTARIFGASGVKQNGSIIHFIDKNLGKDYAGLTRLPDGTLSYITSDYEASKTHVVDKDGKVKTVEEGYKLKKDEHWTPIQSIGMKDSIALQNDPRYSKGFGTISIGFSDKHIFLMLEDRNIRMVIPYHKSGLPHVFANIAGVDYANNYEDFQNTTVAEWYDKDGNLLEGPDSLLQKGQTLKDLKYNMEWLFNEHMRGKGEDAARRAASEYVEWCKEKHPVRNKKGKLLGYAVYKPKFSGGTIADVEYMDFTTHRNYYKLLEDFNCYDAITEEYAEQGPVTIPKSTDIGADYPGGRQLTEQELAEYRERLLSIGTEDVEATREAMRQSGLFTEEECNSYNPQPIFSEAEADKYAQKAQLTTAQLIQNELDAQQSSRNALAPGEDEVFTEIENYLKEKHSQAPEARNAERNAKRKKDKKTQYPMSKEALGLPTGNETKLFSFAGRNSRTADRGLLQSAQTLEENGWDAEEIRQETGWFRGDDGNWRYEIDDSRATFSKEGDAQFKADHPDYARWLELHDKSALSKAEESELNALDDIWDKEKKKLLDRLNMGYAKLRDIMHHGELYEAYPEIANTRVMFMPLEQNTLGEYIPESNFIVLNENIKDPDKILSVLMHEVQHRIQEEEGFANGASTDYWQNELDSGFDSVRPGDEAKVQAIESELEKIKRDEPELYREISEHLKAMPNTERYAPDYDDFDFETGEYTKSKNPEWEEWDAKLVALYKKYGEKANRLLDLFDSLQWTKNSTRNAFELYLDTAGEIEARDTADRLTLSAEERENKRPNVGNPDVVFALPDGKNRMSERVTAKEDTEYMRLAEDEDSNADELRKMVERAARSNGYDSPIVYHGTNNGGFTEFDPSFSVNGPGFYFTDDRAVAETYSEGSDNIDIRNFNNFSGVYPVYLKTDGYKEIDAGYQPWYRIVQGEGVCWDDLSDEMKEAYIDTYWSDYFTEDGRPLNDFDVDEAGDPMPIFNEDEVEILEVKKSDDLAYEAQLDGYPGLIIRNVMDDSYGSHGRYATDYVSFNPADISSAELTTYDDNDELIPLSERFSDNKDIRFQDRSTGEWAQTMKEARETLRDSNRYQFETDNGNVFTMRVNKLIGGKVTATLSKGKLGSSTRLVTGEYNSLAEAVSVMVGHAAENDAKALNSNEKSWAREGEDPNQLIGTPGGIERAGDRRMPARGEEKATVEQLIELPDGDTIPESAFGAAIREAFPKPIDKATAKEIADQGRFPMLHRADGKADAQAVPYYTWVKTGDRGNYGLVTGYDAHQGVQVSFYNKAKDTFSSKYFDETNLRIVDAKYSDTDGNWWKMEDPGEPMRAETPNMAEERAAAKEVLKQGAKGDDTVMYFDTEEPRNQSTESEQSVKNTEKAVTTEERKTETTEALNSNEETQETEEKTRPDAVPLESETRSYSAEEEKNPYDNGIPDDALDEFCDDDGVIHPMEIAEDKKKLARFNTLFGKVYGEIKYNPLVGAIGRKTNRMVSDIVDAELERLENKADWDYEHPANETAFPNPETTVEELKAEQTVQEESRNTGATTQKTAEEKKTNKTEESTGKVKDKNKLYDPNFRIDTSNDSETMTEKRRLASEAEYNALRSMKAKAEGEIKILKRLESMAGTQLTEAQREHLQDVEETLQAYTDELKTRKAPVQEEGKVRTMPTEAAKSAADKLLTLMDIQAGSRQEGREILNALFKKFVDTGKISDADIADAFNQLMDLGISVEESKSYYNEMYKELRGTKIYVSPKTKADFTDYSYFRKEAMAAGIYLVNDSSAPSIDQLTLELTESWGDVFETDSAPSDQIRNLVDLMEEGKTRHIPKIDAIANEAAQGNVDVQDVIDSYMNDFRDTLDKFREAAKIEMKAKDKAAKAMQEQRSYIERAEEKRKQRRRESAIQDRVMKQMKKLSKMGKKAGPAQKAEIEALIGNIDLLAKGISTGGIESLEALKRDYEKRKMEAGWESDDNPGNWLGDNYAERKLARLSQKHVRDMSAEELIDLGNAVSNMITQIENQNKLVDDERNREINATAKTMRTEIQNSQGMDTTGAIGKARVFASLDQLGGRRVFDMLGGWTDGAWHEQGLALEKGGVDKMAFQQMAYDKVRPWMEQNKEWLKTASGKNAEMITYEIPAIVGAMEDGTAITDSVKIEITPQMRVALALHARNMDNLRHIQQGGIVIPDAKLYKQGEIQAAYAKGRKIKMQPEVVRMIANECTDVERSMVDLLAQYFDVDSKEAINGVSMALDGIERAGVGRYYPIETDKAFNKSDVGKEAIAGTAEGIGSIANERVKGAGSPILLRDAYETLATSIENTSTYYGYAIPVRNFNALYNHVFHETGNAFADSMKAEIRAKWGNDATKYIEKLLVDIQGRNVGVDGGAFGKILDQLRSGMAGSTLTLNPSVALSQAASYPGAAAILSPGAMMAGLNPLKKVDANLIAKYTPVYWSRGDSNADATMLQGEGGKTDLGQKVPWLFGWIQSMDQLTIRRLWAACDYEISHKADTKGLKGDEHYEKVAELFNKVVHDTQPNYTSFERSQILRSDNKMVNALTMFKTVSQQYYGMMYEAQARLNAAKAAEEAGKEGASERLAEAKKDWSKSTSALLGANVMYIAIKYLFNVFKGYDDDYEDENGEKTLESVLTGLAQDLAEVYASSIIGGAEAYSLAESAITGESWTAPEVSSLSTLQDVVNATLELTNLGKYGYEDGISIIHDAAIEYSMAFGFPLKNAETYLLGITKWVAPEWYQQYKNLFDGELTKNEVKGMTGKQLEAGVGTILENRTGSDAGDAEVSRLYAAGYTNALPTAIPSYFTWTSTDEQGNKTENRVELTYSTRETYRKAWTENADIDELLNSEGYKAADDKTKAAMIDSVYDYATQKARAAVSAEYQIDSTAQKMQNALDAGIERSDYLQFLYGTKDIESDKDENGKAISGSKLFKQMQYIDSMDISNMEKNYLLGTISTKDTSELPWNSKFEGEDYEAWYYATDSCREGYSAIEDYVSFSDWAEIYETYQNTDAKDENGKTVSGLKKQRVTEYINSLDISDEAKEAILGLWYKTYSLPTGTENSSSGLKGMFNGKSGSTTSGSSVELPTGKEKSSGLAGMFNGGSGSTTSGSNTGLPTGKEKNSELVGMFNHK